MVLIKYFVTGIIFILISIINYINNKTSYNNRNIFEYCNDEAINKAFNELNITGVMFIDKLLEGTHFDLIVLESGNIGAKVNKLKVFIEQDFKQKLKLETFRDSLHEFRHVLDYNIIRLKHSLLSITLIGIIILTITKLDILKVYLPINIYPFFILILQMVILLSTIICATLDIILETKAIKYPAENCEIYLHELFYDKDMIKKIKNYLMTDVSCAIKWYKINIICRYSIVIVIVIILGIL